MRGVVFTGERDLELMEFPDPTPGPDEVVVEMKASGMCGSDLHQYRRPKGGQRAATGFPQNPDPVIAGHEPCGIVAAIGPGVNAKEARVGERVMVHHYQGCTQCGHCRSGWQQLCQEVPVKVYGANSHGGHAKYLKVPANTLVPLAAHCAGVGATGCPCWGNSPKFRFCVTLSMGMSKLGVLVRLNTSKLYLKLTRSVNAVTFTIEMSAFFCHVWRKMLRWPVVKFVS